MKQVYTSSTVASLRNHWQQAAPKGHTPLEQLTRWREYVAQLSPDDALIGLYQANYGATGAGPDALANAIAREHGFADWAALEGEGTRPFDPQLEEAIAYLLSGDRARLESLLIGASDLVQRRSAYGHGATLLHYAGSNGVETRRQRVPYNLAEMIRLLLQFGADPQATMQAYGSAHTTRVLLASSGHPEAAGVQEEALAAMPE